MFNLRRRKRLEVFTQRSTRHVREGRFQPFSLNPVMAFSTQIKLQISRKLRRILDQRLFALGLVALLLSNMICPGAMTALARDARYKALPVISFRRRIGGKCAKITRVTLQA